MTNAKTNRLSLSQLFLFASILSVIITALWLIYPNPNRHYHLMLTGVSKGRIRPFKAKFKPYQGKRMGGGAGIAAVLKDAVKSFEGSPYNVFSVGSEISGTADAYFTRGSAVVKVLNAVGIEAMLVGNIEYTYGHRRLAELAEEAEFSFVSSNILESGSERPPVYISSELFYNPGGGLKIGLVGLTPPSTPTLTARSNIEGLEFMPPGESLRLQIEAMRKAGADLVVLLTLYSRDRIKAEEWRPIASAAPDICVMLDYDIDAPPAVRRDGVIIKTVSGYNQSKEVDVLDLEITPHPVRIVSWKGRRLAVNHAEITPDPQVARVVDSVTRENRELRDRYIGEFAGDSQREWDRECPIGNMITDAMLAEGGCDLAVHNSGGIQNNIQAGDFSVGDLFSMIPFDNQLVVMQLSGSEIEELFSISASLQRGLLQVAGASYEFSNRSDKGFALESFLIGGAPVDPERIYTVCTNSFLADGGDNFTTFRKGRNLQYGRQQRDVVSEYIASRSADGPMRLSVDGRIIRHD
ncbi:MAG: bifunctional metallophosphatase/5'-nucleotidase [Candidatus Riflebacteria bacterium]|nr:bifunctional metallophosphatase/5'-nucleotidase [Candidatus Riflebacteria bacterium]